MTSTINRLRSMREQLAIEYTKADEAAQQKYEDNLWTDVGSKGLEYLRKDRNLADVTIKNFHLGYCADRHAISIPIFKAGKLVNIRYRMIEPAKGKPKYSQEKGCEIWVFNDEAFTIAKEKKGILITEGEFDAMSAWQAGFKNVVSAASGKDSFGPWIEYLENVPRIYIAYDNDQPGKEAAIKFADRLGVDRCNEVVYPKGIKDANDYFKTNTTEDFKELVRKSKPFYSHQFKGLGDIISGLRADTVEKLTSDFLPDVEISDGWLISLSGDTNAGKTSVTMNIVDEFTRKGIPTLVLPFERGPAVVGERFLQVKYNKALRDFKRLGEKEWEKVIDDCIDLPLFFAMPNKDDVVETVLKARRLFGIRFVVIDHLDYMIRRSTQREDVEIRNTLHELKRIAEDNGIIFLVITHIKNIQVPGAAKKRHPTMDDIRGSSAIKQDSECVVILKSDVIGEVWVDIQKNKGKMSSRKYKFNVETGRLSSDTDPLSDHLDGIKELQEETDW